MISKVFQKLDVSPFGRNFVNEDSREFFHENGYLIVNNIIHPEKCDQINRDMDDYAQGDYYNRVSVHLKVPSLMKILTDPDLLSICDFIQDHQMVPIGSIYYFCKPGNPLDKGSVAHQDNERAKAPFGSYFIMSIALDDADPSNGSLIVYPKSHKLRDLPAKPEKNYEYNELEEVVDTYPVGSPVDIPENFKPLNLSYQKGSLIFLHGHVIHYAHKNEHHYRWRRAVYLHYVKDGDPFWPGWTARRALVERP